MAIETLGKVGTRNTGLSKGTRFFVFFVWSLQLVGFCAYMYMCTSICWNVCQSQSNEGMLGALKQWPLYIAFLYCMSSYMYMYMYNVSIFNYCKWALNWSNVHVYISTGVLNGTFWVGHWLGCTCNYCIVHMSYYPINIYTLQLTCFLALYADPHFLEEEVFLIYCVVHIHVCVHLQCTHMYVYMYVHVHVCTCVLCTCFF